MAAPAQPPQASLTGTVVGRFRVGARLGSGGMGEVYVAEDTTLKRQVALKRVSPALRDDPAHITRMFKEAQRASSLAHPCVASIFDVLQEGGEILLVMEYVEGVSLRERLRQKPPIEEVLRIVEQCAGALRAAHEKNIVHGDVKPENIMITPGVHAKLLDFGVARRIIVDASQAETETTTRLEGWGGTPGYLAPEVLLEQPSDGRADLFSLGVVLYEAVTGVQPFRGDSAMSTFDHTLHDDPPALSDVNPEIPHALTDIVKKLIAKRPEQRYASAADLLTELRPLVATTSSAHFTGPVPRRSRMLWFSAVALLLVALAAVGGWWVRSVQKTLAPVALPANRYLAVLPFKAAGSSEGDQAFADGVTAALVSDLTRLASHQPLQIAPVADARKIGDAQEAHRTLGVNLVLQGKVERSGDAVRIDYSLVDARTNEVLRSNTLSVPGSDPFALSDQLTAAATHLLAFDLAPSERRGLAHGTTQRGAYEQYLMGEGYRQQNTSASIGHAIDSLTSATKNDPKYAMAWSSLGQAYLQQFDVTHQRESIDQARQSCQHATAVDAQEASGYVCLGQIETKLGNYDAAVSDFQQALGIDSTSDTAYSGLGKAFQQLNRMDDAERNYKSAVDVRPNSWAGHSELGHFYVVIGRYQAAVDEFTKATELAPDLGPPYYQLAGANIYLGAYDAAIAALKRGINIAPTSRQYSNLGNAYLALHRYSEAITAFEHASRMAGSDYISLGNLARAYACSGEMERARPVYRQAIELADSQVKLNPKDSAAHLMLAVYHSAVGDRAESSKELAVARKLNPDDSELWFFTAIIDVQAGNRGEALKALEHALALGFSRSQVRTAPEFEPLHSTPDFQALSRAQ